MIKDRISVLLVALFWFALGFANYRKPKTIYRIYNWPLTPNTEVGENARTTYCRRGMIAVAIGIPYLVWGLVAS